VAYLINIENEKQISRDPLRGHLFENMVVADTLKYRFNHGRKSNLYFYRDSKGNEVDLLMHNGPDIFPIEIKAGMREFIQDGLSTPVEECSEALDW